MIALLWHFRKAVLVLLAVGVAQAYLWPVADREKLAAQFAHDMCAHPGTCPSPQPSSGPSLLEELAGGAQAFLAPPGRLVVTDARPLFPDVPPGGYPHGVYAGGNCTWWAAYNRRVPQWAPDGDAWRWFGNAQRDGLPTSEAPSVGAIVVYRPSSTYSSHGHVGIVVALGPGTYRVSEMNYVGLDVVDQREAIWPDGNVEGFIPR